MREGRGEYSSKLEFGSPSHQSGKVRGGEGGWGWGGGGGAAHLACFRRDATALGWPKMPIIDGRTVDNGRSCCRAEYRG